jgi:glycosyltransferase involved in cell wall biosynthesis
MLERASAPSARFLPTSRVVPRSNAERRLVLHLLAPAQFGGLESVVRVMATAQRRRGYDVLVVPLLRVGAELPAWLATVRANGVVVEPLVAPRFGYLAQLRGMRDLVAERRPSVVHTHGYHADVVGGLAARRAGAPTVSTVHGFVRGDWKNRLYEWLQRRALRQFDAVIAVSSPMAAELRRSGVPADRTHVVQNAFEAVVDVLPRSAARELLGLEDGYFHAGWIGRLSPEKGADVMLRALARVTDDAVRLSILGTGVDRRRLQALADRLGIAHRVTWHGVVPETARLAAGFDAIVLSSRSEGTPIVLFEAIAAGTPVVVTAVGGVPDIVSSAEALLVPPDDPPALAAALDAVRRDPDAAAVRAQAAKRRLVSHFAVEPWLRRVDDVYASAIETHAARAPAATRVDAR